MAGKCFAVQKPIFFALDTSNGVAINLPVVLQVDLGSRADWLSVLPGLYNAAGIQGAYEISIFQGLQAPAALSGPIALGAANFPTPLLTLQPDAVISGSEYIIPWDKPVQFAIMIRSTTANIAALSRLSFTINPFNT